MLQIENGYPCGILRTHHSEYIVKPNFRIDDDKWHYLVWIVDRYNPQKMYIDGNEYSYLAQDISINSSIDNSEDLRIGLNNQGNNPFEGIIDEVRIYNRVLSLDESKAHYERRKYHSPEPTVTYISTEPKPFMGGIWYNDNWNKRTKYKIDPDSELSNYQVKINVHYQYGMQDDYGDLRFTDSDKLTEIPYWIENYETDSWANVFINVPNIPTSYKYISMYFNNGMVDTTSDFDSTFTKDYEDNGIVGLWHMDEHVGISEIEISLDDIFINGDVKSAELQYGIMHEEINDVIVEIKRYDGSYKTVSDLSDLDGENNFTSFDLLSDGYYNKNDFHNPGHEWTLKITDSQTNSKVGELEYYKLVLKSYVNPNHWDNDGDGLSDYEEIDIGDYGWRTNPFIKDTDGDGLWDKDEVIGTTKGVPTDPTNKDTDRDGYDDDIDRNPLYDIAVRIDINYIKALESPDPWLNDGDLFAYIGFKFGGDKYCFATKHSSGNENYYVNAHYSLNIPDDLSSIKIEIGIYDDDGSSSDDHMDASPDGKDYDLTYYFTKNSNNDHWNGDGSKSANSGQWKTVEGNQYSGDGDDEARVRFKITTLKVSRINTIILYNNTDKSEDLITDTLGYRRYVGDPHFYLMYMKVSNPVGGSVFKSGLNVIIIPRTIFAVSYLNKTLQAKNPPSVIEDFKFSDRDTSKSSNSDSVLGVISNNDEISGADAEEILKYLCYENYENGEFTNKIADAEEVTDEILTLGLPDDVVNVIPVVGLAKNSGTGDGPESFWDKVSDFFKNIIVSIVDFFENAIVAIGNFLSKVWNTIKSWGQTVLGAIDTAIDAIVDAIEFVLDALVGFLKWLVDKVIELIMGAINSVIEAIESSTEDLYCDFLTYLVTDTDDLDRVTVSTCSRLWTSGAFRTFAIISGVIQAIEFMIRIAKQGFYTLMREIFSDAFQEAIKIAAFKAIPYVFLVINVVISCIKDFFGWEGDEAEDNDLNDVVNIETALDEIKKLVPSWLNQKITDDSDNTISDWLFNFVINGRNKFKYYATYGAGQSMAFALAMISIMSNFVFGLILNTQKRLQKAMDMSGFAKEKVCLIYSLINTVFTAWGLLFLKADVVAKTASSLTKNIWMGFTFVGMGLSVGGIIKWK